MTADELAIVRRAYAKQVLAVTATRDPRIEDAFAAVPREVFLGPGPWSILRANGTMPSPSADPVHLYTDSLVAIDPARSLNNGQPSFHASLMGCAAPSPGEHVVHIGAGTGYYSAILAAIVGAAGWVTAIEYDPGLADRARANLATCRHVDVITGDGTVTPFPPADVIYVNAGATRPADLWLDGLKDDGRLVLPLTTAQGAGSLDHRAMRLHGVVFLVTRQGDGFAARRISATAIYPCAALREPAAEEALTAALARGDGSTVTRLHRRDDLPDDLCWLKGRGWCLTADL